LEFLQLPNLWGPDLIPVFQRTPHFVRQTDLKTRKWIGVWKMVAGVSRMHEKLVHRQSKSTLSKVTDAEMKSSHRARAAIVEYSPAPPSRPSVANPPSSCLPERRYIVLPQMSHTDGSVISDLSDPSETRLIGVFQILDSFNCLCLGGQGNKHQRRISKKRSISPMFSKSKVVYPIASYGDRLNSQKLVDQRRKSLPHNFFRPVPSCT
jgi:hypothetical protein